MKPTGLLLCLALGCGAAESTDAAAVALPIIGGDAAMLEQWPALVMVGERCTGVAVGPRHFLTAWHCMPIDSVVSIEGVMAVAECRSPPESMAIAVQDVALCRVEPSDAALTPARRATVPGAEGDMLTLVGFGVTAYEAVDFGDLRAVDSEIDSVDAGEFTAGKSEHGSCVGDSGGPAFRDEQGPPELLGILTSGPPGICGPGYYADVGSLRSWLDDELQQPKSPGSCRTVPGSGAAPSWLVVLVALLRRRYTTVAGS